MESAYYSRLPSLPDPDSFELEKILEPPPGRAAWLRKWARRYVLRLVLFALFLVIAVLYIAAELAAKPELEPIARPQDPSLRLAAAPGGKPDQGTVIEDSKGQAEQVDGDVPVPVMVGAPAAKNVTNVEEEDAGQVSIQDAVPSEPPEPPVPIKATFFSGSEGPKACRGHVIAVINLPKPHGLGMPTAAQCYNFPNLKSSGCGKFVANKADGCQARVYGEPDCESYLNTAAFMAEDRAVGGNWRSVMVQCGIPVPDPATLGKPPMMDQITSMVDNDQQKGGKREVEVGIDDAP